MLCITFFLHTDLLTGRKNTKKKNGKENETFIHRRLAKITYLQKRNKQKNKQTNKQTIPSTFFSIYMKKKK